MTHRPSPRPRPWHARAPLASSRGRRGAKGPPDLPDRSHRSDGTDRNRNLSPRHRAATRVPSAVPPGPPSPPDPSTPPERGFTLVELLVVLAIFSIVLALGVPAILDSTARLRVNLAAAEAATALRLARMTAVRSRAYVAIRFEESGRTVTTAVYGDGDGDGVRLRDIRRGIDPQLRAPMPLRRVGASVRLGFPPGPPPRDPGSPRRRMRRLDDPIRFNRSNMASFSPIGTSTPGSLYFTDGKSQLAVVRLFGRTGKVKVLLYDRESEEWK